MAVQKASQITLADLAKRLNLSVGAVSLALNDKPSTIRVSEATMRRVREMAESLGYRPNRVARILRTGRSGMVGVLSRGGFHQLHAQHLYYARKNAERIGLIPFIYEIPPGQKYREVAVDMMRDTKVDALLLVGELDFELGEGELTIPIFRIGSLVPGIQSYTVDKHGGFVLLAEHLLAQGYRKIDLLIGSRKMPSFSCAKSAIRQVIDAARRNGILVTLAIHEVDSDFDGFILKEAPQMHGIYASGYLGMKRIIESGEIPEAVICSNDRWAQGALRACTESGLRVPEDIALAGFDDDPVSATGILPLTTVSQPLEMIYEAAFSDLQLILSGKQPAQRSAMFPCQLVARESTRRLQSYPPALLGKSQ